MKLSAITTFASLVSARVLDDNARDVNALDVELRMVGNTAVKASITNTGSSALKVFKTGTILDDNAVEKVKVFKGESLVPFDGMRLYVSTANLEESAFQVIEAGESIVKTFDIAHAHDVSGGGDFDVVSSGAISYAATDSTKIEGAVTFKSNVLATTVDGKHAAAARHAFLSRVRRTAVQTDCTGTKKASLEKAIAVCQVRASAAAQAAQSNSAKITEYFKNDTPTIRSTISGVFTKIANECNSTTSGLSKQYCTDRTGDCTGGVIAYTWPAQSYIVNCAGYFDRMVERTTTCHHDDKPFVTMHEMTHLTQVKGTDDYGVYGYEAVRKLSAAQNLNHADTYALFANAIEIGGTC